MGSSNLGSGLFVRLRLQRENGQLIITEEIAAISAKLSLCL
jgi:hypothetical protein